MRQDFLKHFGPIFDGALNPTLFKKKEKKLNISSSILKFLVFKVFEKWVKYNREIKFIIKKKTRTSIRFIFDCEV
jgi:hypothetical protein